MFYSHTILARKGPLGTVWCAAHLQNRLTKSQYTSTNIRSTVERIMFPEVPIALRMSGHLLLGVVRIYSKQVEYLYKECNVVFFRIKEAVTTANVNLPENACHAPLHSITLPETFELDALELDHDLTENRFDDEHKKSQDEITLADQIPTGKDPYVAFFIEPDVLRSFLEDDPGSEVRPMEEDSHPSVRMGIHDDDGQGLSSRDPAEVDNRVFEDSIRHDSPDIGTLRDAGHGYEMGHLGLSDIMEPDVILEKQILEDKEALTPGKEPLAFPVFSPQSLNQQEFPSPSPNDVRQNSDANISFGHLYPDLAMRSSPSVVEPQLVQPEAKPERPRRKRRRQHFDKTTVLTNAFMKRSLEETKDIQRVLKNGPSSSLAIWRSNKRLRREVIFDEPLLTGISADLGNCFQPEYISTRAPLVLLEDAQSETESDIHSETERLRNYEGPGNIHIPELAGSPDQFMPSPSRDMPSSTHFDRFTPSTTNLVSESEQLTKGTSMLPTPDLAGSTWSYDAGTRTPGTSGDRHGYEHTPLFDIPESPGELGFLERDDYSPGSLKTPLSGYTPRTKGGTQESWNLSERTRAVATYLKRQSLQSFTTPISEKDRRSGGDFEEDSPKISLNTILQGKTKKVSARMFNEILVLQNASYVKVQQEEAYGDVLLQVSSKPVDEL